MHFVASSCAPLFLVPVSYISPSTFGWEWGSLYLGVSVSVMRAKITGMARQCCNSLSLVTLWIASYPFGFIRGKKRRGQRPTGGEKNGKGLRHFSMKGWNANLCLSSVHLVRWDGYLSPCLLLQLFGIWTLQLNFSSTTSGCSFLS